MALLRPAPITATRFVPAPDSAKVTAAQVTQFDIPELTGHRLVFVNGHYAPQHSNIRDLPRARSSVRSPKRSPRSVAALRPTLMRPAKRLPKR